MIFICKKDCLGSMEANDSKNIIRIIRVELEAHEILINSVRYLPNHLGGGG